MSEIEEQFYKTFGIEPINKCFNGDCIVKEEIGYDSNICDDKYVYIDRQYPQITDRILLELSALCQGKSYDLYKNHLLRKTIEIMGNNTYKISQVRVLFKENTNE